MMCIVMRGANGSASWEGHRSVEVLSHHHSKKTVKILFLLLLYNKSENNYIEMLHPGNSHCELVKPWDREKGLSYHFDETEDFVEPSILDSVYSRMFKYDETEDKLYQQQELNPNESWFGLEEKKEVKIWPNDNKVSYINFIEELYGTEKNKVIFIPFTSWKMGPFQKTGLYLVTFRILLQGRSFETLVGGREYFPVYGPGRLRSKIRHDFIPLLMGDKQEEWQNRLEMYEDHISFQRSYDVIILKKPPDKSNYSVEVDLEGSCEIALAASDRQPKGKYFPERYVTMDDRFKLNLYYKELSSWWKQRSDILALGRVNNFSVSDT